MKERPDGEWRGKDWFAWRSAPRKLDSGFNPLLLGVAIAMDIGVAMRDGVRKLADPQERERMRQELMRDLRAVRRHEVVEEIVMRDDPVFEHLFMDLECRISPNTVLLYPEKKAAGGKRRDAGRTSAGGQTRRRMLR